MLILKILFATAGATMIQNNTSCLWDTFNNYRSCVLYINEQITPTLGENVSRCNQGVYCAIRKHLRRGCLAIEEIKLQNVLCYVAYWFKVAV